jgi:hypothetical protein
MAADTRPLQDISSPYWYTAVSYFLTLAGIAGCTRNWAAGLAFEGGPSRHCAVDRRPLLSAMTGTANTGIHLVK